MRLQTTGSHNTALGYASLRNNISGTKNTAIGIEAGRNATGDGNVFLGRQAGFNETGSDLLYIETSPSSTPLIWGDFANDSIRINGSFSTEFWSIQGTRLEPVNTGSSVFIGLNAGQSDDLTDNYNTAIGSSTLTSNVDGIRNVSVGALSMEDNVSGNYNVAHGFYSLGDNVIGENNTALGAYSGRFSTGSGNLFLGYRSGQNETGDNLLYIENSNSTTPLIWGDFANDSLRVNGSFSTEYWTIQGTRLEPVNTGNSVFIGEGAGENDDLSNNNVFIGTDAGKANITGSNNTAVGYHVLQSNTTGFGNTAMGRSSLLTNSTGKENTAYGFYSLRFNESGKYNTALGFHALQYNTTENYNTAIGYSAFTLGTGYENSTAIGYNAEPDASNTIRLGNSSVTTIGGYAPWSNVSDGRFKTNIKEDVSGLDFILKLRPVTYNLDMDAIAKFHNTPDSTRLLKNEALRSKEVQSGFIAQEVEATALEIGYDFHGVDKPKDASAHYSLRYAEFVVPLVKALQEQQKMIENQAEKIDELTKQTLELEELKVRMAKIEAMLTPPSVGVVKDN